MRVVGRDQPRVDDDGATDEVGVRVAGMQQRAAAEAVADGDAALDAGWRTMAGDLGHEAARGVRVARAALAHAAEVERDDAVMLGQPRCDEVPPVRVGKEPVQQQHRRRMARPVHSR